VNDRESARLVAVDLDGFIRSPYHADESDIACYPRSTYQDSEVRGMSASPDRANATVTSPDEALEALHKKLVSIRASLAEHGPTDPRMVIPWALDELQQATGYIRAVRKGGTRRTSRMIVPARRRPPSARAGRRRLVRA
jgi:hypothetical protein